MSPENRFAFPDGREMNPFWIYKTFSDEEKLICYRLARSGGPLGWNEKSLRAAHIKRTKIERLVEEKIVKKASLLDQAKDFINDPDTLRGLSRLEAEGGFLAVGRDGKSFMTSFDRAKEIMAGGEPESNLEIRYRIADKDLFDYLNSLL